MSENAKDRGLGGMLIFSIAFLGTFFALVLLIPPQLLYTGKTYTNYDVPSYFSQEDIERIKHFENGTLTRPSYGFNKLNLDFNPDVNFKFDIYWRYGVLIDYCDTYHITGEFFIWIGRDKMSMVTEGNYQWGLIELNEYWDEDVNASVFYPVKCKHITVKMWVSDSDANRNNMTQAWSDGSLEIGMGFGLEDYETTLTAWSLIGQLLTFQAPEVFGTSGAEAIALNLIIALPIFANIAYVIYRLVLMAIPFLGG